VNGKPLSLVQPETLRFKLYEPVLILGMDKFGAFSKKYKYWTMQDSEANGGFYCSKR
jgi:hypothetical protein